MKTFSSKKSGASRVRSLFHGRGQTLAILIFALPAFIGVMGLATGIGNLYFNYYRMQAAVDAAAISAAQCLPSQSVCTATTTASSYATNNGLAAGEVTVTGPSYNSSTCPSGSWYQPCQMTVAATRTVPYYFSRLVGVNSGTVNVTATAAGGTVSGINSQSSEQGGVSGLMPIGLQKDTYSNAWLSGATLPLVYSTNPSSCPGYSTSTVPGDWNWLQFGAPGESTLETNITQGVPGQNLNVGDTVTTEPGAGQPAFRKVAKRISGTESNSASCTYGCSCDSPCHVTVILMDWTGITGAKPTPILGFADLCIDSVGSTKGRTGGACLTVNAHAIACASSGSTTTTTTTTTTYNDGTLAVKLLQ
jgi:Flp pilus assembly protein TadG